MMFLTTMALFTKEDHGSPSVWIKAKETMLAKWDELGNLLHLSYRVLQ